MCFESVFPQYFIITIICRTDLILNNIIFSFDVLFNNLLPWKMTKMFYVFIYKFYTFVFYSSFSFSFYLSLIVFLALKTAGGVGFKVNFYFCIQRSKYPSTIALKPNIVHCFRDLFIQYVMVWVLLQCHLKIFFYIFFKRREREKSLSHLLLHSSSAHSSQSWAGLASYMDWRDPSVSATTCCSYPAHPCPTPRH